jgi:hypothetical protein
MMNEKQNASPAIDERLFDLLVDGELDAARRHELLARLDDVPGGWRRCALAFLEAQAWRGDLRGAVDSPVSVRAIPSPSPRTSRSLASRARNWIVLATALVVAFAAGWLARPGSDGQRDIGIGGGSSNVARRDDSGTAQRPERGAEIEKEDPNLPPAVHLAGILTLVVDDNGQPREVQVPVLEGPELDLRRLLSRPPAIRDSVVQALERRGHRVEAHRQLLTVNLKNGRKVVLPVDQVDVKFANRVYQ